ncbi:MAG: hypothetical protein CMN57_09595 [Gammaproteobacteria bacterium]|nr:hypothetical protein [Gammaproteobacteria bacterium]
MNKPNAKPATLSQAITLALLAAAPLSAQAGDRYWVCGDGWWDSFTAGSCWASTPGGSSSYTQPIDGDDVHLISDDSVDRTVNYYNSVHPDAVLNSLTIDATGSGSMTLSYGQDHNLTTQTEIIGDAGSGSLVQSIGTHTVNTDLILGHQSGAQGSMTIRSEASLTAGALVVGDQGNGSLDVENGGDVDVIGNTLIGREVGSYGSISVDGDGSWMDNKGTLVGYNGSGFLTVTNAGMVQSDWAYVGYQNYGQATVDGADSWWNIYGEQRIGYDAHGRLSVSNGGNVGNYEGRVGVKADSIGVVIVEDAGSRWTNSGDLYVGDAGSGELTIRNGGVVSSQHGLIGDQVGATGEVTVQGNGSRWSGYGDLGVGVEGTGELNIDAGGEVSVNDHVFVGSREGGSGSIHVYGTGSRLESTGVYVGAGGTGTVEVTNGGAVVSSGSVDIGYRGEGVATLAGAGSSWDVGNYLWVGDTASGTLTVRDGAALSSGRSLIGASALGTGTVTLSGPGSSWSSSDSVYVGGGMSSSGGSGTLTVENGAALTVANAMQIWDEGAVRLNGGSIEVGTLASTGSFSFNAGRLGVGGDLQMGADDPLGSYLYLNRTRILEIGGTTTLTGYSTLTLDGGSFSTGALVDNGGFNFERGTFNLTGSELRVGNGGLFGSFVQFDGDQAVNVTQTATVDAGAVLALNNGRFGAGTIMNHGRIVLDGMIAALNGGVLNNAGTLAGTGQVGAALNNGPGGEVRLETGTTLTFTGAGNSNAGRISLLGGTADFTRGLTNASGGQISGHGTLVTGDGSTLQLQDGSDLVVSGDKTYTGDGSLDDVVVASAGGLTNQGALALSGDSDIIGDVDNTGGGIIVVSGGATATFHDDVVHNGAEIRVSEGSRAVFFGAASGAGAYTGNGTVHFEGDLLPGNSPALVTVEGDMVLTDSSRTLFELGGHDRGLEYDAFDIGGSLTLGGALDVEWYDLGEGLFTAQAGDSFDLFRAESITGGFDSLTLASLGAGLEWEYSLLTDAFGSTDILRMSVVSTSAVPVPAAVWLFGSGLLGLVGVARRRRA